MNKSFFMLLLIVSVISSLIGCTAGQETNQIHVPNIKSTQSQSKTAKPSQAKSQEPKTVISHASWGDVYDFQEIVNSADLIVKGTIAGIEETRTIGQIDKPTVFTDFRLDIFQVLKSPPRFDEKSIVVIQSGGTYQDTVYRMEGDEIFQVGEQVLLFLRDASDEPVHTPNGQSKYALMMPGGHFTINHNGMLENPSENTPVADKYRGKSISDLEAAISASIPDPFYYTKNAARAALIVDGIVGVPQSRLVVTDELQSVYTVYPLETQNIMYDDLKKYENASRKTKVYQHSPITVGDKISIFERGGTFNNISQRWAWSWEMKPGTRMLLFLGVVDCGDKPDLCTQEELQSEHAMYFAGGGARFIINPDNTLTAVTRDFFSRMYDGATLDQLSQDLVRARESIQEELERKQNQPVDSNLLPPPPTRFK